jgi:hypothetical protein
MAEATDGELAPDPAVVAVLHALVVKGFAEPPPLAGATGLPGDAVDAALAALSGAELVRRREGRVAGWLPTPAGRAAHRRWLQGPLAPDDPAALLRAYENFGPLNADLKALCTDWQLRPADDGRAVTNDHADPEYDEEVVARLVTLDGRAATVCAALAAPLPRVVAYRRRLESAVAAVVAGDRDRFTTPLVDSYHDVWMELHQDLLLTLDLRRSDTDI